jgi:hypothetical protein
MEFEIIRRQVGVGGAFQQGRGGRSIRLTNHVLLVPRLRMSGFVPLLLLCAFMAITVRTLLSRRQVENGEYCVAWIFVRYIHTIT